MRKEFEAFARANDLWTNMVWSEELGRYRVKGVDRDARLFQAGYEAACAALGWRMPDNRHGAAILPAEASAA